MTEFEAAAPPPYRINFTLVENEAAVLRDAAADAQAVYTFVGWMLVIGALSLVAVQRRKLKSASLYDRRSKA